MPGFVPWTGSNGSSGFSPYYDNNELAMQVLPQAVGGINQAFSQVNAGNQRAAMNQDNNQAALNQLLAQLQAQQAMQGVGIQAQLDLGQQGMAGQMAGLKQQGANNIYGLQQQGANSLYDLLAQGANGLNLAKEQNSGYLSGLQQQGSNAMNLAKEQTSRLLGFEGPLLQALNSMFGGGMSRGGLEGVQGNTGQSAFLPTGGMGTNWMGYDPGTGQSYRPPSDSGFQSGGYGQRWGGTPFNPGQNGFHSMQPPSPLGPQGTPIKYGSRGMNAMGQRLPTAMGR